MRLQSVSKLCWAVLLVILWGCNTASEKPTAIVETTRQVERNGEAKQDIPVLLFFGNSLTAGFGVDPSQAFPHLIQDRLDSLKIAYQVVNAGLSGETSASGTNRIEWVLREPVAIMVLELGGNDGLRGISTDVMQNNLQEIIDLAKSKYPGIRIILAGMEAPPNMGQDYIQSFHHVFPHLAQANNLPLIPFLLEGVAGEEHLNLPDGIHPNEAGHKIVADNIWEVLINEISVATEDGGDN